MYLFFLSICSLDLDLQATQKFFDNDDDDGERQRSFKRKDSISLAKWTSNYPITTYGNISFPLLIYIVSFYYKINSHGDDSQRKDNCLLYTFFQMYKVRIYHLYNGKKVLENKIKFFQLKKLEVEGQQQRMLRDFLTPEEDFSFAAFPIFQHSHFLQQIAMTSGQLYTFSQP